MARLLLLTGRPGVGKTTILRRVADSLEGVAFVGFYTEEIREGGRRRGFRGIPFGGGEERVIASTEIAGGPRVSRYGVDVEAIDRLTEDTLAEPGNADVVLLDEIGKMECLSTRFVEAVRRLADGDLPLVATVSAWGGGFMAEIREQPEAELWEITEENRDRAPAAIRRWIERGPGRRSVL